ncbi:EAL domain-containing protein [Paraburkholderia sp. LEh10]|uniref:putative bifunctional diguanylate cyclase/phosphodiesterase n=1 Tax=Paraburkholderia sp. LEh10 TaxID=2821353 RepID=UPI001AE4E05E|nr:EAL domain-containing protein [Paraburkholderia sp. LEh10]MBP0594737.1 EAL domain-containing protein [Paraburkholderia sp. LEh10]
MTSQRGNPERRRLWRGRFYQSEAGAASHDVPPARRTAVAGLTLVLLSVPLLAFWGAYESLSAGSAARSGNEADMIFEEARYSVAWEESAERKYFLDPRPEVRRQHVEAGEALDAALTKAITLEPQSAQMLRGLLDKHAKYRAFARDMFEAVDQHDIALANEIDEKLADPLFDDIGDKVIAAAAQHRLDATIQLDRLVKVQRIVLISTPVVLLIGVALALLFLQMLRRIRRSADAAAQEVLKKSEQRLRALVANTTDAILVCNTDGVVTYEAPTRRPDPRKNMGRLAGTNVADPIHPADRPSLQGVLRAVSSAPRSTKSIEIRTQGEGDAWRHVEMTLTNLLDEPAVGAIVATASDITERKHFEAQLTRRAFYDSLTGLPNRALLLDRIGQAAVRARRRNAMVGLIFVDLDHFKRVNDSLGHHAGDRLLIAASERLQQCLRPTDTVARLGGDEFVMLLEHLGSEAVNEGIAVAERILEQLNQPFDLDGKQYRVGASLGLAFEHANDLQGETDVLLRDADVAMYRAKNSGRSRYVIFEENMHAEAVRRLEIETDLRHAIDRHELRVHFQPIMHLQAGGFHQMEALVRWQHPVRGLLPPAEFIGIAEESGLIIPLGRYVLEQSCQQVAKWQKDFPVHPPLQVSVNLSPGQFDDPHLIDDVASALRAASIGPASLKLEVTEGLIMRNTEKSIETLRRLKEFGVTIAIDDFGTGYSSLSYLRRLPLDVLKIDRSFVQGIGQNTEDDAIVRAIVTLAQSLGLSVTAEGIETPEQASLLREWSCDSGQGYLFSRPLAAEDFAALFSRHPASSGHGMAAHRAAPEPA